MKHSLQNNINKTKHARTGSQCGRKVVIVGGGIASLVAGIELRVQAPEVAVEILTDAEPEKTGGQVASWDEHGYPIEHGLHALFGFYDQILPLLQRIGAIDNFTRSPNYVNVYEHHQVHRFRPRTWPLTYTGFTWQERLRLATCLNPLSRQLAEVERSGLETLAPLDRYDLREFLAMKGIPSSILSSNFIRSLYDGPFNQPHPMSAAMGLQSLYRIFARPWHYHFNYPARVALVDPLRDHFLNTCGGTIRYQVRMKGIRTNSITDEIDAITVTTRDGQTEQVRADDFIVALGIESFKQLDLEDLWTLPYFKGIRKLESVSSLSLQAWFRQEPSPKQIDTLLVGLPEPLSILSPLSRVRPLGPNAPLRLPYELIATGPEGNFASMDDETIAKTFMNTLRSIGFTIPSNWQLGKETKDGYVILRRNRKDADRYLLTRPGDLAIRPSVQSPIPNLMIAGAWTGNSLALPCVNSAAESGKKAAETILSRFKATNASSKESTIHLASPYRSSTRMKVSSSLEQAYGMPRTHPLVIPPPYEYRRVLANLFLVGADSHALDRSLPPGLQLAPGFHSRVVCAVLDNQKVACANDPSRSLYCYHEFVLAAVVTPREGDPKRRVGLLPLVVYVDDDTAMAVGREVYGFPKKMGQVEAGPNYARLTRRGRSGNEETEGPAVPITLLNLRWDETNSKQGKWPGLRSVVRHVLSMGIFNERAFPVVPGAATSTPTLTWVRPSHVRIDQAQWIRGAKLSVGQSTVDPLRQLLGETPSISVGVAVDCGFTFGLPEAVNIENPSIQGFSARRVA